MEQQNSSTKSNRGTRILVVGLCCIDEIDYVDKFPAEDSDTRIFEQTLSLGGNAANSVTVLSQLNTNCELFASIPANNSTLESLIKPTRICIQNCVRRPGTDIPKSTVILNRINGSRTVLHYRGSIPELTAEEFIEIFDDKLDNYSWIHFEGKEISRKISDLTFEFLTGRNCDEIKKMIEYTRAKKDCLNKPIVSVELEKLRPFPFLEQLIPLADLMLVSKDFAQSKGWNSMTEAVEGVQKDFAARSTVICAWGEKGAAGRVDSTGEMVVQEAFNPSQVIDTLAAGDCFIGACLNFLNQGFSLKEVLENGCRIAGKKCGQRGLLNLKL